MCGSAMRVLITGSTSVIGSQLSATLKRKGNEVFGTSRHVDATDKNLLTLDFANTAKAIEVVSRLPKMDAVVLSAGMTKISECERNPELSRVVNVISPVALAKRFVESGCQKVIFISSSRVFDGNTASVKSHAEYSPIIEYGRQKAQAEVQILGLGDAARVIRFTKVLAENTRLLVDWVTKIRAKEQISAFTDVSASPITKKFTCAVIESVLVDTSASIVQASATDEISYFEIACSIAEQLGADKSIVRRQTASEAGEKSLLHSSLESSIFKSIQPVSSLSAVRQFVKEMV